MPDQRFTSSILVAVRTATPIFIWAMTGRAHRQAGAVAKAKRVTPARSGTDHGDSGPSPEGDRSSFTCTNAEQAPTGVSTLRPVPSP